MILDASAVVAILREEPEAAAFMALTAADASPRMCSATVLETHLVEGPERFGDVDDLVREAGIEVVAFGSEHLRAARHAHERYGRGRGHPAQLNYGDCMSYALAKVSGEPLLFKGEDFTHTDVEPAYRSSV